MVGWLHLEVRLIGDAFLRSRYLILCLWGMLDNEIVHTLLSLGTERVTLTLLSSEDVTRLFGSTL